MLSLMACNEGTVVGNLTNPTLGLGGGDPEPANPETAKELTEKAGEATKA